MTFSYPKKNRLLTKSDFHSLKEGSRKFRDPFLTSFYKPNNLTVSRAGFSINSKNFNAVQRNRLKRVMRDIFRHEKDKLSATDFLVVVSSKKKDMDFPEFIQNITCSFRKFLLNLVTNK